MEGYANVNSNHEDYDDLNIESRSSTSDDWKKKDDVKQESWRDLERRVLSLQVPLDDGTGHGYVFSFKLVGGVQRWRCHLCDILVIGSRHVDTHIQSKKHQVKLALPSHPRNLFTRIEPRDRTAVEVPALAPGEPVPPGFEDVVRRVAQIQATLDAHRSSPLIGLEYMVELTPEERGKEPMYVCMLCDKKGDPRVAMAHMTSFNHRSKYIGIHFPTASKLIATEFQARKDSKKVVHLALIHLCTKVEERFGRLQPLVVDKDTFDRQRDQIKTQIEQDPHFCETAGDKLVELLDRKIIDALVQEEEKREAEPAKPDPAPVTVFNRGKISCDRSRLRGRSEEDNALEEENVFKKLAEMEKKATEALKEKEKEKAINESKKGESMGIKKDNLASADTKSLSSISSISSSSLSLSRSKSPASRSRSRSRSPFPRGPRHPFVIRERDRERDRNRDRDRDRNRDRERFRERERPRWPSAGRGVRLRRTRSRSRSRRTRSRSRSRSPASRRRPRLRSRSPRRRSSLSPSYRKKGSSPVRSSGTGGTTTGGAGGASGERRARENERSRWLKFREEADRIDRDMIDKLKFHEKNPEKHPMYPEEWKKFWNRRYKELQAEGKDPAKHDFKPEWIEYWNRRMREMYDEELKSKKDEWRVRLGLPEEGEEPTRSQPVVRKRKLPSSLDKATADDDDLGDDVIVLSPTPTKDEKQTCKDVTVADIKNTWKALTGTDIKDSGGTERRSPSPWEDTDYPKRIPSGSGDTSPSRGNGKWWQNNRGSHSVRTRSVRPSGGPRVYEPSNGPGGIVNSLRMLTALESQLGSLGPQVNALLPKALALEKIAIDSSEQLLADPSNFALFETCREKLKGQLFAGIVERNMVMATRTVVQGINMLLAKADKIGPSPSAVAAAVVSSITPVPALTPVPSVVGVAPLASPVASTPLLSVLTVPPSEPVIVPGIGTMDKVAIAQQIAEALVLQGKTDVSQEELETLINAVVGMAQASAASQEPISAAAYARQQGQQQPITVPVAQIQTPLTIDTTTSNDKVTTRAVGGESPFTQLLSSVTKQAGSGPSKTNASRPSALQILQSAYNESSRNGAGENLKAGAFSGRPEKMDDLSEEDLKTLLQNFKELPSEEQYGLISYLKKVEAKEPTRVERLRQFVNVGHLVKSPKKESVIARKQPNMKADSSFQNKLQELKSLHGNDRSSSSNTGRLSPFSLREGGINPSGEERPLKVDHEASKAKVEASDDDDDDDYSFEDIYAAASRKVKEREKAIAEETAKLEKEERKKEKTPDDPRVLLRETKAIIANLMGQLPAKFIQKQSPVKESPATPRKTEQSPSVFPEGSSSFLNNSKPPMFNLENLQQSVEQEAGLHSSSAPLDNNQYYPNFMDTNAPGDYGSQYPNQYPDQGYSEQPIQQNYPQSGYEASYSDGGYYSNIQQQQTLPNQSHSLPQQTFQSQQYNQNPYNSGYSEPGMVNPGNQYPQSYQPAAQNYPTGYGQYSGQQGYY